MGKIVHSRSMEDRSLAIGPGAPAHIYHSVYRRPFWRIARRYTMSCVTAFSLSCPRSNVINGTRRTPYTLLVYDRVVFLSVPRCYTFDASHRRSPFYFSWSNITRSLSIGSSAATSIIKHAYVFRRYLFSLLFARKVWYHRPLLFVPFSIIIWSTVPPCFILSVLCPVPVVPCYFFYRSKLYFLIPLFLLLAH